MKESNIQFQNPFVEELKFRPGENREENYKKATVDHEIKTEISQHETKKEAKVKLIMNIEATDALTSVLIFHVYLEISSFFKWDENLAEEEVEQLLKINGTSLLLSYARPIISYVVSLSGMNAYHLPFLNLSEID